MLYAGQDVVWMTKNIETFMREGYQANVDVFACIDLIARAISHIPILLYSKPQGKKGDRKEIDTHPILDLLARPNPEQAGPTLIDAMVRYLLGAGNSYVEAVSVNGVVKELWALMPHRMSVLVGDLTKRAVGYRYQVGMGKQDFVKGEVLQIKTFHPTDDFYGLSPIEIAANQIDTSNFSTSWDAKLLKNDMRPSGMFIFKQSLSPDQREEFNDSVKDKYMDVDRRGLPLVMDGEMSYEALSQTSKDADYIEMDKKVTRKICRAFNIPPELIGDSSNKTYSNYQEARDAFYLETVLPIGYFILGELNNWLIRKFEATTSPDDLASKPKLELDFDLEKVEALQAKKNEAYARMGNAWWVTMNEKRVACGYAPLEDGGETFMLPLGLTAFDPMAEEEPPEEEPPEETPPEDENPPADEGQKALPSQSKSYWTVPERKKALWQTFEQRVAAREKEFEKQAKQYLAEQAKMINEKVGKLTDLSQVNPDQILDIGDAVKAYGKKFWPWYRENFIRAGNAGVHAVKGLLFDDAEFKIDEPENEKAAQKPTSFVFTMTAKLEKQLRAMVFDSGTEVNKTTVGRIYRMLKVAQNENWTVKEFAQKIYEKTSDFEFWRAQLWARTESAKVDNFGQVEGYKATEFVDKKGWLCSMLATSRDAHISASEQEVGVDDDFDVGGESLAYPGDPIGDPGNVCNCLCTVYPVVGQ